MRPTQAHPKVKKAFLVPTVLRGNAYRYQVKYLKTNTRLLQTNIEYLNKKMHFYIQHYPIRLNSLLNSGH
jgi:hypothetical protein